MKKTTIKKLISDLKEDKDSQLFLVPEVIAMLDGVLHNEREQIIDAFEEGLKYGKSEIQTFDYPAIRYFGFTYGN